ncbi:MAG: UDP-N-acetylmuramate:L-alanyl-gamma-D-glutamyl-meso-diaminopimelate ligase [SAR324 cluster bacterium]|nr:UDP-N-acetylmuramate:L-alanyl-gamma-D-glutamyl-meso-diaminopimelate ligase [SAR324 cluster bacterium]
MIIKRIHFCGVGGVAMASLAVMCSNLGYDVSGSDLVIYSPMKEYLLKHKIRIFSGYKKDTIKQINADVYIIGNALSRGNIEVETILNEGYFYLSLPEFLKIEFLRQRKNIVITGTHGKTSVTSLSAFLLDSGGLNPGFMVGGVPAHFDVSARAGDVGGWFVIEGDEYDTSLFDKRSKFFHYLPRVVVINNLEFDHGDIFTDLADIKKSFKLMLRQLPANGVVFVNGDDEDALSVTKDLPSKVISFGLGDKCDVRVTNFTYDIKSAKSRFNINTLEGEVIPISTSLWGEFNARNITAGALVANYCSLSWEVIKDGISNFKNVARRLDLLNKSDDFKVYDDFSHHPTAILETSKAIKKSHLNSRLKVIYEPRSNTSIGKIHQASMAKSFFHCDKIIIYPSASWRKLAPDKRLDIDKVVQEIGDRACVINDLQNLKNQLIKGSRAGDILIFMSQGDFGGLPKELGNYFDNHYL